MVCGGLMFTISIDTHHCIHEKHRKDQHGNKSHDFVNTCQLCAASYVGIKCGGMATRFRIVGGEGSSELSDLDYVGKLHL